MSSNELDRQRASKNSTPRIYFDNAATSWPKPPAVAESISKFYVESGSPAFRGTGIQSDSLVEQCRAKVARFVGANHSSEIVFTFNGTDSLNTVIHGVLEPGDHVVISELEHNSTLRPLNELIERSGVKVTRVGIDGAGVVQPDAVMNAVTPATKLVCLSHASNVTGVVQPVEQVGALLAETAALFLVDAAQTLGQYPVDVANMRCDFLAAPGHKGLYGPLGTGILYVAERVWDSIRPFRQGGTGTQSELETQPVSMPTKLESGNLNVGGILGLGAGMEFVHAKTVSEVQAHCKMLVDALLEGLGELPGVQIHCIDAGERVGLVSFAVDGIDPREFATILSTSFGVEVRAGYHCSPGIHRALGTFETGGSIRVSFGCFNSREEIDIMLTAVREVLTAF